jgi:hypothetical protein
MTNQPTQYKNWREWWDISPEANPLPPTPSYEVVSQVTWIAAQRQRDSELAALKAIAERLAGAIKRMKAAREDCVALRNWAVGFEDWADVEEVLEANTEGDAALSEFHAKVKEGEE